MELENQVCSFEQAKQLKELGVCQNTFFVYTRSSAIIELQSDGSIKRIKEAGENVLLDYRPNVERIYEEILCSAFTVAELGVMIDWNHVAISPPYKDDKLWYMHTNQDCYEDFNEAIARAKILIYLLENNLTTAEEVNNRLIETIKT